MNAPAIKKNIINVVASPLSTKYLGLNIHKSLSWDSHIDTITKKANSTLAFLGRNVSRCPTIIKAQCYTTLVRPTLEYASSIWSPSKKDIINKVEAVQRRAARFVTGDYQSTSSVPAMLQQFQWQTVQCRRAYAQRVMMYRIVYNLVDIPAEHHLNGTSSNQRPFTTIPGTTHKNYSVQDIILPTSHAPLEPTTWKCGGSRHPRQVQNQSSSEEEEDEVACLTTDCCFSALTLLNSNWACLYLIQSGHNQHLICNLSSPWYGC